MSGLLNQLEVMAYGKESIKNYQRILNKLKSYMRLNKISYYHARVGDEFIENFLKTNNTSVSYQKSISTVIRRLNDFNEDKQFVLQNLNSSPVILPKHYLTILEDYLFFCSEKGNCSTTIKTKEKFCTNFIKFLMDLGCENIKEIDSATITKACLRFNNHDAWAIIRMFLKFLHRKNQIEFDYSTLIPKFSRPRQVPITYTEDEILRFEKVIDLTSDIGIRDYAMLLLATRLGMRSGDIVKLSFDNVNFENNSINFVQQKNLQPLEYPLLPEIKVALMNYITNGRPPVSNEKNYIFLRHNAPYQAITTSTIRFATTKYFKKAEINISNKKHGAHTFRSSLASSMINEDISYDIVRKVLGHSDQNAIKHYAKVDIERLREYAISVPKPTGLFEMFLKGDLTINGV